MTVYVKRARNVLAVAIEPGLALLPPRMTSVPAKALLLAIGLQESRLLHQKQIGGPAHGLWQFERNGGVLGVMTHPNTREHAKHVAETLGIPFTKEAIYYQLPDQDDRLDAAFARLLLWTHPKPLPTLAPGQSEYAWNYYLETWRPGKPHRHTWNRFWAIGIQVCLEAA